MSQIYEYKEPLIMESYLVSVSNANTGSDIELLKHEAVTIENGTVHFHPSKMIPGRYYDFVYNNKPYLIRKGKGGTVDIFKISQK